MVKLTIDHIPVEVKEGISVMEAAAILGIQIPSMCFRHGFSNHPSCMVCLVKDLDRDHLIPSCAMPVSEGMNILTDVAEVRDARREAIELLLSDHVGDCEAPCRLSCPAFMDIPLMNRLIAAGNFKQALSVVREEIALPLVLGYICPAPCEKACKRKPLDQAVSICLLKRSTAQQEKRETPGLSDLPAGTGKKVAVIGTGPAGLSAAFFLLRSGHACVLYDQHEKAGGALQYDIPNDKLPKRALAHEIGLIREMGAEFRLGTAVTREIFQHSIRPVFDAVILATGSMTSDTADIFGIQPDEHGAFIHKKNFTTNIPGIFACGNIIREQKMAVHSVAQGKMAAKQAGIYLGTTGAGLDRNPTHKSISATGPIFPPEWEEYMKESIPDHRVEPAGGFLHGFDRKEAIHEAKRCLHCDCRKPVGCKLRMYAEEFDASRKRFAGPERKLLKKSVQHEFVVYETEKCIRCGLCVEITEKHGESIGLTFAGRGFDVRISAPFHETIRQALAKTAGECVGACPTGALAFKDHEERNSL
jgi:NADPH-dependent glutamate synthase beta subunit-like oxidoreductase